MMLLRHTFGAAALGGGTHSAPPGTTLRIGPMDCTTSLLKYGTYKVAEELNGHNTFECELVVPGQVFVPTIGQDLALCYGGARLFAGLVSDFELELVTERNLTYSKVKVQGQDWTMLVTRRLAAKVYTNQNAGDMVRDLIASYLAVDGIVAGVIQTGPLVTKSVFNYETVGDSLKDLGDLTEMVWTIDYYKSLHFVAAPYSPAQFVIDQSNAVFRRVKQKQTLDQYRNVQYVRAGQDLTNPITELFGGDGKRQTFTVGYPIGATPTITVNGNVETVGVRQVDSGKQWYWQKGDANVTPDAGLAILTSSDVVSVTYQGLFPVVALVQDGARIAARQAVEGGSGRYEMVEDDAQMDGSSIATARSQALVTKYGTIDVEVEFETDVDRLVVGQLATVTVPAIGATGVFLITTTECVNIEKDVRRYQVTAVSGQQKGTMTEFWAQFAKKGQTFTIRENEVIQSPIQFNETVHLPDTISAPLVSYAHAVVGTAIVGYSEV